MVRFMSSDQKIDYEYAADIMHRVHTPGQRRDITELSHASVTSYVYAWAYTWRCEPLALAIALKKRCAEDFDSH
jgi:hypothetical protein